MLIKVPALALRPGDRCVPTGTRILSHPSAGLKTPAGKVEIEVMRVNGTRRLAVWGANTRIAIERNV